MFMLTIFSVSFCHENAPQAAEYEFHNFYFYNHCTPRTYISDRMGLHRLMTVPVEISMQVVLDYFQSVALCP